MAGKATAKHLEKPLCIVYRDWKPVSSQGDIVGYEYLAPVCEFREEICKSATPADAERIAACINACRNVSMHDLEHGPGMYELLQGKAGKK